MDAFTALYSRKSTRDFLEMMPGDAYIEKVLSAGMTAPVGRSRYETMHLTVVSNYDLLQDITHVTADETSRNRAPFYGAPVVIFVSSNNERKDLRLSDTGCIIENMAVAARALGLASIYLWGFIAPMKEHPDLVARLNLPEGYEPISALGIGYAKQDLDTYSEPRHTIDINYVK